MFQLLLKPYRHIFHYTVSSLTQSLKIRCKHNWSSFFFSPMISKDTKVSIWGLVLLPPGCYPASLAHMEPSAGLGLELPLTQYLHQPQEETRNGNKLICLPINLCSEAGRDGSDKQVPISRRILLHLIRFYSKLNFTSGFLPWQGDTGSSAWFWYQPKQVIQVHSSTQLENKFL